MRRAVCFAAVLLAWIGLRSSAQQADLSRFLRVQNAWIDPSTSTTHVELVNSGTKTITAYELKLGYGFDDPVIDEFFISIGLEPELPATLVREQQNFAGGIRPGETRTISRREAPGSELPGRVLSPQVTAVVFADRTAAGDEAQINDIFTQRAGEAAEWAKWQQSLSPILFDKMDREQAKSAIQRTISEISSAPVDTQSANGKRSAGAQMARSALVYLLNQARQEGDPQATLAHIAVRATVLSEHSQRREVANQ